MEVDHELVEVDEFDALAIEVKLSPTSTAATDEVEARALWPLVAEASGKYPAKEHAKKVAKELGARDGLIYLLGQESQRYEDSDMAPEFRQRRYFYYLSGAGFANCAVTYEIARDWLILWIPYTDPRQVLWYGTTPGIAECKERLHVDDVRYTFNLTSYLHRYLRQHPQTTVFALHPGQTPKLDGDGDGPPTGAAAPHIDTARLRPAMDAARVVKTDYEVALIRQANAVTSAAHRAVLERLRRLTNECELEAIFQATCMARGAKKMAYPVIAGSGTNAATLHYEDNDQSLAGRQLVVLDAGCEWACYASDVTRTLPLTRTRTRDGRLGGGGGAMIAPTPEAAAIYAVVERMQDECVSRVRPGASFRSLHARACAVAVGGLLRLGLLRGGTAGEVLALGTVAAFFPHGLGHHVGLEVHDVAGGEPLLLPAAAAAAAGGGRGLGGLGTRGRGAAGRREWVSPEMAAALCRGGGTASSSSSLGGGGRRLEKNMVVTIEPGIYFCREYIEAYFLTNAAHAKYIDKAVLEKYYPVGGVRIEDDILVTEDGYENLTTAPKGDEALRIINGS